MFKRISLKIAFAALFTAYLLYVLFPFYWMLVNSLKQPSELFLSPVNYLPSHPNFANYVGVFTAQPFARNILNSVIVAGGATVIALLLGILAAYALGRHAFTGRQTVLYAILGLSTFPQVAILGGLFLLTRALHLFNTYWALIFSYTIFTLPFTVWVLAGFIREIPVEMEEAALVDGARPVQILRHVILPVMLPGIVATGLLSFINAWNEFLYALTLTVDNGARTVPVAIAMFSGQSEHELPWGQITAASVIVSLPVMAIALIFQRHITQGLTAGAVKG